MADIEKITVSNAVRIKCPNCGCKKEYSLPANVIRSVRNPHKVDGSPSGSIMRSCKEMELECPSCGESFHIDYD